MVPAGHSQRQESLVFLQDPPFMQRVSEQSAIETYSFHFGLSLLGSAVAEHIVMIYIFHRRLTADADTVALISIHRLVGRSNGRGTDCCCGRAPIHQSLHLLVTLIQWDSSFIQERLKLQNWIKP